MQMSSYLTFSGNCREAMTFYQNCLGGHLVMQTIGESPFFKKMPKQMENCILHATLINDSLVLQGSDMVPESGLIKGNSVSMALNFNSEEDIRRTYATLSSDGHAEHPLDGTFWGGLFGGLTDKYGNHWLLNYSKKNQIT